MNWNSSEKGFQYWSDKIISYKNLETVTRKYVLTYDCKENYIDKYHEFYKKYKKLKDEINNNIEQNEENSKNKENAKNTENAHKNIFVTSKKVKNLKTKINKEDLVCEKANKYIKKGKIIDINFTIKKREKVKKISFRDWDIIKLSLGC